MSTNKRSLAERLDEALKASPLTPSEADRQRQEEWQRLRRSLADLEARTPDSKPEGVEDETASDLDPTEPLASLQRLTEG